MTQRNVTRQSKSQSLKNEDRKFEEKCEKKIKINGEVEEMKKKMKN